MTCLILQIAYDGMGNGILYLDFGIDPPARSYVSSNYWLSTFQIHRVKPLLDFNFN